MAAGLHGVTSWTVLPLHFGVAGKALHGHQPPCSRCRCGRCCREETNTGGRRGREVVLTAQVTCTCVDGSRGLVDRARRARVGWWAGASGSPGPGRPAVRVGSVCPGCGPAVGQDVRPSGGAPGVAQGPAPQTWRRAGLLAGAVDDGRFVCGSDRGWSPVFQRSSTGRRGSPKPGLQPGGSPALLLAAAASFPPGSREEVNGVCRPSGGPAAGEEGEEQGRGHAGEGGRAAHELLPRLRQRHVSTAPGSPRAHRGRSHGLSWPAAVSAS